jgi:predicted nucleic acid-binding protein
VILLDTNVVLELMRSKPDSAVLAWVGAQTRSSFFLCAVTQAEILYGIALLPRGKRSQAMAQSAAVFWAEFEGRILPFDSEAAAAYADISAQRRASGQQIDMADAQIAAVAQSQRLTLATRNVRDFGSCGIQLINPFDD